MNLFIILYLLTSALAALLIEKAIKDLPQDKKDELHNSKMFFILIAPIFLSACLIVVAVHFITGKSPEAICTGFVDWMFK